MTGTLMVPEPRAAPLQVDRDRRVKSITETQIGLDLLHRVGCDLAAGTDGHRSLGFRQGHGEYIVLPAVLARVVGETRLGFPGGLVLGTG